MLLIAFFEHYKKEKSPKNILFIGLCLILR
jgi:hypothetical protein